MMKKKPSNLSIHIKDESDFYLRFRCFFAAFFAVLYWIFFWKDCISWNGTVSPVKNLGEAFCQKGLLVGSLFEMIEESEGLYVLGIVYVLVLFLLFLLLSQKKVIFTGVMGIAIILTALRTGWMPGMVSVLCLLLCLLTLFIPTLKGNLLLVGGIFLVFLFCFFGKAPDGWNGFLNEWEQWKYDAKPEVLPSGKLEKACRERRSDAETLLVQMEYPSVYYLRGFTGTVFECNTWSNQQKTISGYEENTGKISQLSNVKESGDLIRNPLTIQNVGASRRFLYLPYECITGADEFEDNKIAVPGTGDNFYAVGWRGAKQYECIAYESLSKPSETREEISADCLMLTKEEKEIISGLLGKKQSSGSVSALSVLREVRKWMKEHLRYDTEPGKIPEGESFARWFLEEEKKGYDVQYATAAVMFFRYYGIPARYVEGYLVTQEALSAQDQEGKISVREKDAHAWAEIYQEETGWVPVEVLEEYENKMGISWLENLENPAVGKNNKGEAEITKETAEKEQEISSEQSSTTTEQKEPMKEGKDLTGDNHTYNIEETRTVTAWERGLISSFLLIFILLGGALVFRRMRRLQKEKRWKESEDYGYCVDMYYRKLSSMLPFLAVEGEETGDCLQRLDKEFDEEEMGFCNQIRQQALFSNHPITREQRDRVCSFLEKEIKIVYSKLSPVKKIKFF